MFNEKELELLEEGLGILTEIADYLKVIAEGVHKTVNEGITIYTHDDGPEAKN